MIFDCTVDAYEYGISNGRNSDAEKYLLEFVDYNSVLYAQNVIKGRWLELEPIILKDAQFGFYYIRDILKQRSLEFERCICEFPYSIEYEVKKIDSKKEMTSYVINRAKEYIKMFPTDEVDICFNILDADLKNLKIIQPVKKEVQEKVLLDHPDLVNQIIDLDPVLKEKYSSISRTYELGII